VEKKFQRLLAENIDVRQNVQNVEELSVDVLHYQTVSLRKVNVVDIVVKREILAENTKTLVSA